MNFMGFSVSVFFISIQLTVVRFAFIFGCSNYTIMQTNVVQINTASTQPTHVVINSSVGGYPQLLWGFWHRRSSWKNLHLSDDSEPLTSAKL